MSMERQATFRFLTLYTMTIFLQQQSARDTDICVSLPRLKTLETTRTT